MSDNKPFVLITGASSGIGEACAYALAREKRNLLLVARRIDKLEKIRSELENKYNITVMVFKTDLVNLESIVIMPTAQAGATRFTRTEQQFDAGRHQ